MGARLRRIVMLVPKKDRLIIYKNLFIIKLLTSLKSRGYVTERFSWQWYYWYLTNEGIEYLREYLHLPEEIVPATLKKSTRPAQRGVERDQGRSGGKGGWGDGGKGGRDDGYRRGPFGDKPEGGFGGKGGGFGRGGALLLARQVSNSCVAHEVYLRHGRRIQY